MMEMYPLDLPEPDFGSCEEVRRLAAPATPRSLFCALLSPDEHVGAFEPAYRFARAALARAELPPDEEGDPGQFVDGLLRQAGSEIEAALKRALPAQTVSTWPRRLLRELAPIGLTDGAWLHGAARVNAVESKIGMRLLKGLMLRFGDPGSRESYVERYAMLLRSTGIVPASITRWEHEEELPCTDISYEHALLGVCIGIFPTTLFPETVGFNLWSSAFGPCRLLYALKAQLGPQACTRYFDLYDVEALKELARSAAVELLAASDGPMLRRRLGRGFLAAHRSHLRWVRAMCGGAIPMSPRAAVLDTIRRKARFAADHHTGVYVEGESVAELLGGSAESHRALLDQLARSPHISPGKPDESTLLTESLAVSGPMFEAFTATEILELREWIASLDESQPAPEAATVPTDIEGEYHPFQDEGSLIEHGERRFAHLPPHELLYFLVNADRYPAARLYARRYAESILRRLDEVLATQLCESGAAAPAYSEAAVAARVAQHHDQNLRWREQEPEALEAHWQKMHKAEPMLLPLDGCWLQGFVDVCQALREEYGWLFRIYASEQGDGNIDWNHNRIYRLCFAPEDPRHQAAITSMELFAAYREQFLGGVLLRTALSLHTRHFLPELLGLNLANEASGVGGTYLYFAQRFAAAGSPYRALDFSLHNCIDNYASGHTKWSLSAVQAFMSRVQEAAPAAVEAQWQRIWRFLRLGQVFDHGTEAERRILAGLWLAP